jgi:hypothetical protein
MSSFRRSAAAVSFAVVLCLTLVLGSSTVVAKDKPTPRLFKNTTYKPLGCGGEDEPCVKGKTTSVKNKLSLLTFSVPPLSFDFVQGSDLCPDQNHGKLSIGKRSAVQFDKDGKFSFEQAVTQSGESMTGSGVKSSVDVTWKITGKIITKYGFRITPKYVSSGACTVARVPTLRGVFYASHGEN